MSDFDVFLADCPARTTLEVVGHTWSVVVVVALGDGPLRYGELLDRIGGISNKMLTQTLARLRGNGLLTSVDGWHDLTDLGRSLLTPVRALAAWAEEHTGELLDARQHALASDGTETDTPEPHTSEPHTSEPHTATSRSTGSHSGEPRTAGPDTAGSNTLPPRAADSPTAGPRAVGAHAVRAGGGRPHAVSAERPVA